MHADSPQMTKRKAIAQKDTTPLPPSQSNQRPNRRSVLGIIGEVSTGRLVPRGTVPGLLCPQASGILVLSRAEKIQ